MAYYLNLDGSDQYVDVSPINYEIGDAIEVTVFGFSGSGGASRYILDSDSGLTSSRPFLLVRADGTFQFNASSLTNVRIDGVPVDNSVTIFPTDGGDHIITAETYRSVRIAKIGSKFDSIQPWNAGIKNVRVSRSGADVNHWNKQVLSGANDTVLDDTVGGNDGTLVNFPTDNSQWIFYSAPSAGVDVDVTEISASALESSSISVSANITASVTEVSTDASESSATTITTTISASITELSSDASESSGATITNNLITLAVTEVANDFSESVSASIAGIVGVAVTELNANASESSAADISANISAAVTEIAADFEDDSSINFVGSFTVEVTETSTDFEEACYIQLPVMRLIPRKTISVSKRSSTIRVNKRNHTIRVR